MTSDACCSSHSRTKDLWVRRAILLSWATIIYNVVEGLVSTIFGWAEESVALFGFGVDAFIEVASASVVLWRFRTERDCSRERSLDRERRATMIIGYLFLALALAATAGATIRLAEHASPDTTVPGMVISLASLSFMFFLWAAKRRTARALDSATIASDAACSLACIQLSGALLAGSLLFMVYPDLWWVDSAAALVIAVLIGREGVLSVRAARSSEFAGGCGCH